MSGSVMDTLAKIQASKDNQRRERFFFLSAEDDLSEWEYIFRDTKNLTDYLEGTNDVP